MASLIGSIKNLTSDAWWFVKIGIYAGVLFFILDQGYYIPQRLPDDTIKIFLMVLFFLFLGIASVTINRNINNRSPIFPGPLDIFEILFKGIFATIAIIPGLLVSYILFNYLQSFTFESIFVLITIYLIAVAIMSAFIFIPVVLVSVRGNLFDLFRLDILFRGAGNYIVQFLSYLIQYALIIGVVTAIIYFFLLEMLGDHCALLYLKCLIIVISFFSIFSYSSDLYGDAIPEIKIKEKSKKKLSREEERAIRQEKKKLQEEKNHKLRLQRKARSNNQVTKKSQNQPKKTKEDIPQMPDVSSLNIEPDKPQNKPHKRINRPKRPEDM